VVGATDPAAAEVSSLRGQLYNQWRELGLASVPTMGDNGVHASASPFEGLAERMNWLRVEPSDDPFGHALLDAGVPAGTIRQWTVDPQVALDGSHNLAHNVHRSVRTLHTACVHSSDCGVCALCVYHCVCCRWRCRVSHRRSARSSIALRISTRRTASRKPLRSPPRAQPTAASYCAGDRCSPSHSPSSQHRPSHQRADRPSVDRLVQREVACAAGRRKSDSLRCGRPRHASTRRRRQNDAPDGRPSCLSGAVGRATDAFAVRRGASQTRETAQRDGHGRLGAGAHVPRLGHVPPALRASCSLRARTPIPPPSPCQPS
jgi:hypothetical protein